ncbi:hypothetical protein DFR86_11775 [Acidianus sulfidivorans JP7]|uniref:Uncharacterized protein n=1 Tax=Acidianus sulfidivorans JP7 TaxID=619593 RepID=A0A2U9IJ85_9CREN|nr:hypothetical protein [Acidianus sulfidivorans]AWR98148.1 hypothetical protein DFR86_11775 [Acidianus sulfidivorans JP7]
MHKENRRKGLSSTVAIMIILFIIILNIIPWIYISVNNYQNNNDIKFAQNNYIDYADLYRSEIYNGIINISYFAYYQGGQYEPCLEITENPEIVSPQISTLNISIVFYLENGNWVPISNGQKIISLSPVPQTLSLPTTSKAYDIEIVLNNGIMVFLAPNSSTGII